MSSQLDAIKARARLAPGDYTKGFAELSSNADIPALVAALESVLALHHPAHRPEQDDACDHCDMAWHDYVPYPCLTVAAIHQALGEGEK